MPLPSPGGAGNTRAQQIVYYATYLATLPGTYEGNYTQYDGMTWAAIYEDIANTDLKADPLKLADAVLGVEAAQSLGKGLGAAENQLGAFINASEKGVAATNFAGPFRSPLEFLDAIGHYLSFFTERATWIRIAEFLLGGALVLVAVAEFAKGTPAGNLAKKVIRA